MSESTKTKPAPELANSGETLPPKLNPRAVDLTGRSFGFLKVIRVGNRRPNGTLTWLCHCTRCSVHKELTYHNLKSGRVLSCGKCRPLDGPGTRNHARRIDAEARTVEALSRVERGEQWHTEKEADRLKALATVVDDVTVDKVQVLHAVMSVGELMGHRVRPVYMTMIARCTNPVSYSFSYYGGRGISVCERWLERGGFANFIADMGLPPGDEYSIDRRDNDGDYCPENCRWATPSQQARNKRSNRYVTYGGETMLLLDLAGRVGVPYKELHRRLARGWSIDRAVSKPFKAYLKERKVRHV